MVVFEVSINGRRTFAMAAGEFGSLAAVVSWCNEVQEGTLFQDLSLSGTGWEKSSGKHLEWPEQPLKTGDEVTLRIVDATEFDQPDRMTAPELNSKIRERAKQKWERAKRIPSTDATP
jgi:hypothetical protein